MRYSPGVKAGEKVQVIIVPVVFPKLHRDVMLSVPKETLLRLVKPWPVIVSRVRAEFSCASKIVTLEGAAGAAVVASKKLE
jgi:hypothetical protein